MHRLIRRAVVLAGDGPEELGMACVKGGPPEQPGQATPAGSILTAAALVQPRCAALYGSNLLHSPDITDHLLFMGPTPSGLTKAFRALPLSAGRRRPDPRVDAPGGTGKHDPRQVTSLPDSPRPLFEKAPCKKHQSAPQAYVQKWGGSRKKSTKSANRLRPKLPASTASDTRATPWPGLRYRP